MTASAGAAASASTVGKRSRKRAKNGLTVLTVVCCSMISDSHTRYGSGVSPGTARHGSLRRWRAYQTRRTAASDRFPAAGFRDKGLGATGLLRNLQSDSNM